MRMIETEKSYAKINLHLGIGKKREDGYHSISSLFHLINFFDLITIEVMNSMNTEVCIIGMPQVPTQENLMYKAALLYLDTIGAKAKIIITIKKRMPIQGGLGGGSSNAATVLLLLQRMFSYPLYNNQLYALGSLLGSDVPFFLYQEPLCYVSGRGEIVTPIPSRKDLSLVLSTPHQFGVSTKQAFHDLDKTREAGWEEPCFFSEDELCHIYKKPVKEWSFYNDFKNIIIAYNDLYSNIYTLENKDFLWYTSISGSGSSFYTITDKGDERAIFDVFEEKYRTQVTNTLTNCIFLL
ncbi:MAG: 4-(cytidine 5'-diphospho)-2-C-methyl-D-erythritol kinase [Spirochaetia bacterium]|nr:4-(cytidine 5'-diphospho)-2-C-methyl-D-erythritol kinase [Spirochaetia bacterium]